MTARRGLGWYARRLSVMGPREIAHRLREQGTLQWLRLRQLAGAGWPDTGRPAGFAFCVARAPRLPPLDWDDEALAAAAPALLAGEAGALGFAWRWSRGADNWHRAPDTGRAWPRAFFADIDYREGNPSGDARVAWEPARLQWLVALGRLAATAEPPVATHAAALLEDALADWVAENPPWRGVHWISAMECALRLVAACHAVDLARARLARPEATWLALARLVDSHAGFIAHRLSLHSSAGNHTIAEGAGLVYAAVLFPELPGASRWRAAGLAVLAAEAPRQVLPDGGGVEQATCYLAFVTDLLGLACGVLRHAGATPPAPIAQAAARGAAFLARLEGAYGVLPPLGDGDDGCALSPFVRRPAPVPVATPIVTFPDAGLSVIAATGAAGAPAVRALLDHGPLGMAPSCGHGHADALALLVRHGATDVLADAGTYTYTGDPAWRRWFRSTAAHNTVTVDGADQATQRTAFMWAAPYEARLLRAEEAGDTLRLLARHDGYARAAGVVHRRGVALHADGTLVAWDRLDGTGTHRLALAWHTPLPVTMLGPARFRLGNAGELEIAGAAAVALRTGSERPPGGWRSTRYGVKTPITTLHAEHDGALPHEFVTVLAPPGRPADAAVVAGDVETFRRWST